MSEKMRELVAKYKAMAERQEPTKAGRVVHGMCVAFVAELEAALAESGPFHPDSQRILEEVKGPVCNNWQPLTKAEETSGEWTLQEYDSEQCEVMGEKELHIAFFPNTPQGRKRAQLLIDAAGRAAAAPELSEEQVRLDELDKLTKHLTGMPWTFGTVGAYIDNRRALLRKAGGK